jgi:flagellar biogenesis protein FliO
MRRLALASVIALTLTVTAPALADTAPEAQPAAVPTAAAAPTVAPAKDPVAPVVAAPVKAPAAPVAPVVAKAPSPTPATPAPTSAPVAAPAPAPAPVVAAAPAAAAPVPAKEADVALALRPTKELTLAAEPAPIPWPYKLLFGGIVLAAGVVVWKKRRALAAKPTSTAVRVLSKTTTGMRGELALVEVGGMRLLIGITPGSMQTLAILPDEASDMIDESLRQEQRAGAAPVVRGEAPKSELAARARSLFSSLDLGPAPTARPPLPAASSYAASRYADERDIEGVPDSAPAPAERAPRRRAARELPLEGQARGLALALGNRK